MNLPTQILYAKEKMGRTKILSDTMVISTRIEKEIYCILCDIAAMETITTGKIVSVQELIRKAVKFTYRDNEMLRECFRKSRSHISKRVK